MHMKFFTIPAFGGRAAAEEFEQFLAAHRIIAVDREFVQDGRGSAWALCVSYDGPGEYRVRSAHPTFVTDIENRIVESDASLKGDGPVTRIIDSRSHPLSRGMPPEWASGWGEDEYGVWVEFTIDEITQKMRWIPPGRFMMGSPEDEPGRFDNEGPRHEVILTHGYWLFDTPCTQALWQAVTGDNPSRFQSPDRPVENVSWEDCQAFLKQINLRLPGLNLVLPTDAQWEYACRAGTDEATYAGPIEILGDANVPALDPITWYGGNSGVDFELENGENAARWLSGRQYPDDPSGTHPVNKKRANPWGLYDMLGNVWEWCLDGVRNYRQERVVDPKGSESADARCVLRGGAWAAPARHVRCACRFQNPPGGRGNGIGFRPARVQS